MAATALVSMSATPVLSKIKPVDLPVLPQSARAMLPACARDDVQEIALAQEVQCHLMPDAMADNLPVDGLNLPAVVLGPEQAPRFLEASEPPLGILPDSRFSLSAPIALQGGALYLYSDGVTEAKTADGKVLGRVGLVTLLQRYSDDPPMQRLQAVVNAIQPQQQLHDDITQLMISGDQV